MTAVLVDNIARNLRRFMDARAMTKTELARTSGVARTTLIRLLQGLSGQTRNPCLGTLDRLADCLGVSVLALLGAAGEEGEAVAVARDSYIQPAATNVPYKLAVVQVETIADDGAARFVLGVGSRQATMPTLTRIQRDALVGVLLSATRFPEDTPRCVKEMF